MIIWLSDYASGHSMQRGNLSDSSTLWINTFREYVEQQGRKHVALTNTMNIKNHNNCKQAVE